MRDLPVKRPPTCTLYNTHEELWLLTALTRIWTYNRSFRKAEDNRPLAVPRWTSAKAVLSNTKYCSIRVPHREGAISHCRMHEGDKITLFSGNASEINLEGMIRSGSVVGSSEYCKVTAWSAHRRKILLSHNQVSELHYEYRNYV